MKTYSLTHLSTAVLLRNTDELVAHDRENTADLLAHRMRGAAGDGDHDGGHWVLDREQENGSSRVRGRIQAHGVAAHSGAQVACDAVSYAKCGQFNSIRGSGYGFQML